MLIKAFENMILLKIWGNLTNSEGLKIINYRWQANLTVGCLNSSIIKDYLWRDQIK